MVAAGDEHESKGANKFRNHVEELILTFWCPSLAQRGWNRRLGQWWWMTRREMVDVAVCHMSDRLVYKSHTFSVDRKLINSPPKNMIFESTESL